MTPEIYQWVKRQVVNRVCAGWGGEGFKITDYRGDEMSVERLTKSEVMVAGVALILLAVILFRVGLIGLYWDWFNGH